MIVLAISTVADACEVTLGDSGTLILERIEPMQRGHDARLAPLVAEVLATAGRRVSDLDRVAVLTGPGSFTGLRVGIAFAIGLCMPHRVPLIGVPSLFAVWEAARLTGGDVSGVRQALMPAQRRPPELSWWVQEFGGLTARETETLPQALGPPAEVGQGGLLPPDRQMVALPSARAALSLATRVQTPEHWPARAVYVRLPDAALPASAADT